MQQTAQMAQFLQQQNQFMMQQQMLGGANQSK